MKREIQGYKTYDSPVIMKSAEEVEKQVEFLCKTFAPGESYVICCSNGENTRFSSPIEDLKTLESCLSFMTADAESGRFPIEYIFKKNVGTASADV